MDLRDAVAQVFEHARGMWRYRWLAVSIGWLISLVGWPYVYSLPDVYQASAKISVDTKSLINPLMQGLMTTQDPMSEVQLVSKAILSRPNVEAVARETELDLRAGTPQEMEDLVTGVQRRIKVSGGSDNIFTIEFQDFNRAKARQVVGAIVDNFVENALGAQGDDTDVSEMVLASEIRAHEERLMRSEADLGQFKRENIGYMPGASGDYYKRLQSALGELGTTENRIRLLSERRDELARQIQGEEPVFGIMPTAPGAARSGCSQAGQIAQLDAQLSALRVDFTDKHPRIVALKDTVTSLERRCAAEVQSAGSLSGLTGPPGESLEANPVYQNLRIQLSNAEVELAELRGQLRSRQRAITQLQGDVDKIGQVETDLKQLNRGYDVVQSRHKELLKRWEDLQSRKRLDPVTDKVQFRSIEPPFALADPVGPNRPLLLVAVLIIALGAGIAVPLALNQLNPVFFTRNRLTRQTGLPVLGSISMMTSRRADRSRRLDTVAWGASYILLVCATAAVILFEAPGATLLRNLTGGIGS